MPAPKRQEFPDFTATVEDFKRLKLSFLLYAGNTAVNFAQDRFKQKGFIDSGYTAWDARKEKKGKKKKRGSLLLVTGRLKNSIAIKHIDADGVLIGTDVPYAQVHNEGSRKIVSVKPHKRQNIIRTKIKGSFNGTAKKRKTATLELLGKRSNVRGYQYKQNIPQRKFLGESKFLMARLEKNLTRAISQLTNKKFK